MVDTGGEGRLLPQFLRLEGKACLLVGDGPEAGLKGLALLAAGAELTLVAAELPGELQSAHQAGRLRWRREPWVADHLDGMWWAVSASPDRALNARLAAAAEQRRVFLNVVDQPEFCSAQWPALVSRPPVTVAIATGGRSPLLAGWLKQRIAEVLPEGLDELAGWLASQRPLVAEWAPTQELRAQVWRQAREAGLVECYLAEGREAAAALLQAVCRRR